MGKGQRATQVYRSTEFIEQRRDEDGLVLGGDPFKLAPSTSASLLETETAAKRSMAGSKPQAKATATAKAASSSPSHDAGELESVPTFILVTTYLSFLMLIIFAHLRDFFGKLVYPEMYVQLREQNGYAPMVSDFESL
ncbi:serine palmitoyltransferase component, partial [Coemansia sp. RSA 2598]